MLRHVAVPLAILLASLPDIASAQTAGTLRGRIFDAYTNAPLAGATVGEGTSAVVTGVDGNFALPCRLGSPLPIRKIGYEPFQITVARCSDRVQAGLTPGAQNLNEVSVIASREAPSLVQPLSVSTLSRRELTRGSGLFLDDALNLLPGVRMDRRTMSGGQRITIRGYGNRTNFDGSGYKAYLNGIPLTDAEGVTYLDDVDFATLGRVEVIRGPASSLYGGGIGGVVNMYSVRPERPGTTVQQDLLQGQDGLRRFDTRVSSAAGDASFLINYGQQDYDSYRVQSASKKRYAMFVGDFRPSDRRTISTFFGYSLSRDQRAGQLDSASFFGKRNVGEQPYLDNDAYAELESVRAGISQQYRLSSHINSTVTAYYSGLTREDIFAVGVNPRSSQNFGGRAVLDVTTGGRIPLNGTTGIEYLKSNAFLKSYPLRAKVQGGITNDLENRSQATTVFTQWDATLPAAFTLTAGASVNFIEYSVYDRLANTANPTRRSVTGRQVYDPVFIPRVALRRSFGDNLSTYLSVSGGFTPSTANDAVIAFTGQANDGLRPERATQTELGVKGSLFDKRLSFQVAAFDLSVKDKLTSQGVFNAAGSQLYSYTVNAGDQRNRGLEVAVVHSVLGAPVGVLRQLRPFVNYTYSDFTYRNFKSDANNNPRTIDYAGRRVVGVPRSVVAAGVDAEFTGGVYLSSTVERRDGMPLTFDNVRSAPGYTLVNGKAGVRRDIGSHLSMDASIGGTNLSSALYYTMVFLNANYAGAPPAIYLPGPYTTRWFGGLSFRVHP